MIPYYKLGIYSSKTWEAFNEIKRLPEIQYKKTFKFYKKQFIRYILENDGEM